MLTQGRGHVQTVLIFWYLSHFCILISMYTCRLGLNEEERSVYMEGDLCFVLYLYYPLLLVMDMVEMQNTCKKG